MFRYEATCVVWASSGKGAWHFVTLPPELTEQLKVVRGGASRAWGSMRVEAVIGQSRWRTSLFPDSKAGAFLLPIKADVRAREGVKVGETVQVAVEVVL